MYVSLASGEQNTALLEGLLDTGADAVLASDLLAEQIGIDLADNEGETPHAVGGRTVLFSRHLAAACPESSGWSCRAGAVSCGEVIGVTIINARRIVEQDGYLTITLPHAVRVQARDLASALG